MQRPGVWQGVILHLVRLHSMILHIFPFLLSSFFGNNIIEIWSSRNCKDYVAECRLYRFTYNSTSSMSTLVLQSSQLAWKPTSRNRWTTWLTRIWRFITPLPPSLQEDIFQPTHSPITHWTRLLTPNPQDQQERTFGSILFHGNVLYRKLLLFFWYPENLQWLKKQ